MTLDHALLQGEVLLRSRIEITRLLDSLCADRDPVVTYLDNGETLLVSRLLEVEPEQGWVVLEFGASRAANAQVLAMSHIRFVCAHKTGRIEFVVKSPREVLHEGRLALKADFPESLVRLERRHVGRLRVPPKAPVRFVVELASGETVKGRVADISASGFGALLVKAGPVIRRGDRLRGVRVSVSRRREVRLEAEVRYAERVIARDRAMLRLGCRFLGDPGELNDLLQQFVVELSDA